MACLVRPQLKYGQRVRIKRCRVEVIQYALPCLGTRAAALEEPNTAASHLMSTKISIALPVAFHLTHLVALVVSYTVQMHLLACLVHFILHVIPLAHSRPVPDQVFTVNVPSGYSATNHSSNDIFCVTPAPWSGVIIFYLGNYAAHAATVITYPGEPPIFVFSAIIYALFFPASGMVRGLGAIFRHARLEKDDLQSAARAGALCHVVRTKDWRRGGEEHGSDWRIIEGSWAKELPHLWPFFDTSLERPKSQDRIPREMSAFRRFWSDAMRMERKIHGTCLLPDNGHYALAYVPRYAEVKISPRRHNPDNSTVEVDDEAPVRLSSSYSFIKAVVALAQVLYASATLYKATRGPQIAQFGYAAFGLSVAPYLVMSIVNLIGNILTPDYDALYLVNSNILQEAVNAGAIIDGTVGELVFDNDDKAPILIEDMALLHTMSLQVDSGPIKNLRDVRRISTAIDHLERYHSRHLERDSILGFTCPRIKRKDQLLVTRCRKENEERSSENESSENGSNENWIEAWVPAFFRPSQRFDYSIPGHSYLIFVAVSLMLGATPLLPVGLFSKFRGNNSTHAQRVWSLCWMIFGTVIGTLTGFWCAILESRSDKDEELSWWRRFLLRLPPLIFAAPGIGGYIVVGQMLRQYGNCVNLF